MLHKFAGKMAFDPFSKRVKPTYQTPESLWDESSSSGDICEVLHVLPWYCEAKYRY